jgi:agmatine/peptidylarginine deiminase
MTGRWLVVMAVVMMATPMVVADEAQIVPPEVLARIVDEEPNPLPRFMTPEERLLPPLELPRGPLTPPAGQVRTPAEYDPAEGILIAWEGYTSVLIAMTVGITTGDPTAIVYVVVDSSSEQASVTSTLTSEGADMSQVRFIVRTTDSVWIRDYGPRFIFEDEHRAMVDHTYNRPRPNDNLLPDHLSSLWGEPQYDIPLEHGGGNYHLFSHGAAFMTELILNENPGLTAQQIIDLYAAYLNVDQTITDAFPTYVDSTQHIDMWMLPVDDDEIIIGEYSPSVGGGVPYAVTEGMVSVFQNDGYTVHRTPGWSSGGTHYTYTNSVIVNDLVFMCTFGVAEDAVATSVFETAFETSQVIPVDCSSIIHAAGALHCVMMHVPANPIFDDGFESGDTSAWAPRAD